MLDLIRNHKRLMLFILVILVFPAFVFMGVWDYAGSSAGAAGEAARVGRVPISVEQVRRRMEQDGTSDPSSALDYLIMLNLWSVAAQDNRVLVGDGAVGRSILPLLPRELFDANNQLNMERYTDFLRANNYASPSQFEEVQRLNLMLERVQQPTLDGFTSQADVDQLLRLLNDRYVLRQQVFSADQYLSDVELSTDELKQYYAQHQSVFMQPERVDIEYVILDASAFAKSIEVSEEQAREYYEQNKDIYAGQVGVSHILLEVPAGATAEQKQQIREKAQAILEEVRQEPSRFAEIAKENSEDPGSASNGGALGMIRRGTMVEPFEDAAFLLMNQGDISDLVETSYGYHIIMRTSPSDTFEMHRAEIEDLLRRQMANQQFAQAVEDFREAVYVNRDSLEPVAQEFGLTIQRADHVTAHPQPGATGVVTSPEFITEIFSQNARDTHQNIQAVAISPTQLASGRVLNYTPAQAQPFEEVEEQVRQLAARQQATVLAQAAGREALALWQQDPQKADDAPEASLPRLELSAMYGQAPSEQDLPLVIGADTGDGYSLARVERVESTNTIDEAFGTMVRSSMNQMSAQAQREAFLNYLGTQHKVQRFPQELRRLE